MEAVEFVNSGNYLDPLMVHHISREDDATATAREFFFDVHPVFGRGAVNNQKFNSGGKLKIEVPKEHSDSPYKVRQYLERLVNDRKTKHTKGIHNSEE